MYQAVASGVVEWFTLSVGWYHFIENVHNAIYRLDVRIRFTIVMWRKRVYSLKTGDCCDNVHTGLYSYLFMIHNTLSCFTDKALYTYCISLVYVIIHQLVADLLAGRQKSVGWRWQSVLFRGKNLFWVSSNESKFLVIRGLFKGWHRLPLEMLVMCILLITFLLREKHNYVHLANSEQNN